MRGAAMRLRREREMTWWGAMLPHLHEIPSLDAFTGSPGDPAARAERVNAAWDKIDRALARH